MCSAVSLTGRSGLASSVAGGFMLDPSDTRASLSETDVIQATELARFHAAKLLWHGKHIGNVFLAGKSRELLLCRIRLATSFHDTLADPLVAEPVPLEPRSRHRPMRECAAQVRFGPEQSSNVVVLWVKYLSITNAGYDGASYHGRESVTPPLSPGVWRWHTPWVRSRAEMHMPAATRLMPVHGGKRALSFHRDRLGVLKQILSGRRGKYVLANAIDQLDAAAGLQFTNLPPVATDAVGARRRRNCRA